jgi:hypothetical protein
MKLRHLLIAASVAVLTACATTTPYQPATKAGGFDGYSQTMLTNNKARITFGGNSLTNRDTVENYLLYRSAEMAIERGFDGFSLTERDTESKTRVDVSPRYGLYDPYFNYSFYRPRYGWSQFHRYSHFYGPSYFGRPRGSRGFRGFGYDPFFNDYDVREITKYRATAEVTFTRGYGGERDNTFNAREVINNLGPQIVYPEEKG